MRKTKLGSVILSLLLCLSLLSALPACAASASSVLKTATVQGNNLQYSANYNRSRKTLTYKLNGKDASSGVIGDLLSAVLAQGKSSVSQKTRNEALAYFDGDNYSVLLAMLDIVRSGKVNTIRIVTPEGADEYTGNPLTEMAEYTFKRNSKNQVTSCSSAFYVENTNSSGHGGEYKFGYDSQGDLKSVSAELAHTPQTVSSFIFRNGKLSGIRVKSGYDDDITTTTTTVKTDASGRPVRVEAEEGTRTMSYDSQGNLLSDGETSFTYNNAGELVAAKETYYDWETDATQTVTMIFTYQNL